ncbi:MAG: UvrD-helicase domain-containing protein [Thermodesulfobacteriota bacterium]
MDQYRADLHIHSKYSRATSKGLTPRHLAAWARAKGLDVVATGDFTHPQWLQDLKEQLVPDGQGLMRLKDARGLEPEIPWLAGYPLPGHAKFLLSAEISSIYKRGGKVRKVHNLVYVPGFEAAEKLNARLARVGNLASDGRPILGLDSRHLLEMVLETDPLAFLVPAHIWTPWFSLFGSKSGFDSVEECFGSLSEHIFALETGLSSDPEMNRLLSSLDNYRLISNSDAHSGDKLGREANLFSGPVSYEGIYHALRGEGVGHEFLGTVEFFPEEGKYHLDGHSACGVVMDPHETRAKGGVCPVCGKPLTVGVLHRVMELADREQPVTPQGQPGFVSLIPLSEVLGEIHGVGPSSKRVKEHMARLLSRLGPELSILSDVPLEDLSKDSPVLAEAVGRMRQGKVFRQPGFDGQYGRIRVFSPDELARIVRGASLVSVPDPAPAEGKPRARRKPDAADATAPALAAALAQAAPPATGVDSLNERQRHAATSRDPRLLVLAGPGTGKTHTLMARIRHLIGSGADPASLLVVTFTRRAAQELKERLGDTPVQAGTLHAMAHDYWTEAYGEKPVLLSEEAARRLFAEVNPDLTGPKLKQEWQQLTIDRERMLRRPLPVWPKAPGQPASAPEAPSPEDHAAVYARQKASWNLADYTDLLEFWLEKMESGIYESGFKHVLVDEVQDLSPLQLAIIRALAHGPTRTLFAIGDPNQSIYGFRGAVRDVARELSGFWPELSVVSLEENYRSSQAILDLAHGVFPQSLKLTARRAGIQTEIMEFTAPQALREVSWMAEKIRQLLGPTSLTLTKGQGHSLSPGDIAILTRFKGLMEPIQKVLTRFGVPCSVPEAEAFWADSRVKAILNAAGRFLGMAAMDGALTLACPDRVLAKGPKEIAFYLRDVPPFDHLFWQSPEFGQLVDAYSKHGGWAGLLTHVNAQSELELVGRRSEKVRIMTLHAAKGLEFEVVFMPALEDGILPFAGMGRLTGKLSPAEVPPDEAEEERLFYVGLTRAKSRLYLSHAEKRELYGRLLMLKPSRFLKKLDLDAARRSRLVARTVRKEKQLDLI